MNNQHGPDIHEVPPTRNDKPAVWDIVIEDMKKRDEFGREKHKGPLQPFKGRDALWDAYQEALDLVVYLRQAIFERDNFKNQKEIEAFLTNDSIMTREECSKMMDYDGDADEKNE